MSKSKSLVPVPNNESTESLPYPTDAQTIDILPDLPEDHATSLSKLQVSDGDFYTKAAVNQDGRIDIEIDQVSKHLASQVVPTLQSQLTVEAKFADPFESLPAAIVGQCDGLPPPRMNIVIHVVGSRGDVQPFVALGKVLHEKYGHRVRLATHPTFKTFVEENGLEFFSIGGDPAELMAFMVKNPGLMPGLESLRSGDVGERRRGMYDIVKGCWRSCIEAGDGMTTVDYTKIRDDNIIDRPFVADAIIANPPSFAHIHCAERLGIPLHLMFTMPWSPTQSFPHPLTTIHSSNAEPNMTNLVSYALVEMMTWQGLGDVMNRFRTKILGLEPVNIMWAPGMASRLRIPFTYCWSPALIPKPEDWGGHIFVSGFYFLSLASSYVPEPKLVEFLEKGKPPVYIGFGSIVVDDPQAMTRLIFDAIKKAGIRALVSKGWGGLGGDDLDIPDNIYMLGNVPHDYLFKHVSAVVHHGGAGTTAAGILAGRPTVVVPFFGDQPFWGAMTARAGAGPDPVPFKSLTADALATAILKALEPDALVRARMLGEKISQENGAVAGAKSFHDMLHINKHRCSVVPSRVAVARIKRTNIRLSGLAAIVLGDEGYLKSEDIKLYRPVEYDTEDGPWDPLTGGASALLGTLSSLMVGIADVPVEIITALRSNVQNSALERAQKLKAASQSSLVSNTDSTTSAQSTLASKSTQGTSFRKVDSPDLENIETKETTPSLLSQERRSHTFNIDNMPAPKHSHTIHPNDGHLHKASVMLESGATNAAATILRPAMDISLSLTRGFHNAPKLYGDDTVRHTAKIVDFKTGVGSAGKEFVYGWYDGITGLVTQPFNGAKKDGIKGFLQGIGKGVGGFILKPGSAIFGLGGYTFKGIYRELQKHLGATTHSYIIASRLTQGHQEWENSTLTERQAIVENYLKIKDDPAMIREAPCPVREIKSDVIHHHHNSSTSSLESKPPSMTEHKHNNHAHSIRKHFSHHKDQSATSLVSDHNSANENSQKDSLDYRHLLRDHFHKNHSMSEVPSGTQTLEEHTVKEKLEHKHSLRAHFHKHDSKVSTKDQASNGTTELDESLEGIPAAHEAEVRKTMTIN